MRIASLQPSISLTLASLNRLNALCACTKYCLAAIAELAVRNLPIVEDNWSFDRSNDPAKPNGLELLLAAQPDLVIASVPYRIESLAAILRSGLPVLLLAPHNLSDVAKDIRLIAHHVDARESAEALIAHIDATIQSVRSVTAGAPRPLVYCEEWGKPLIHSQHWAAELIEAAGGRFLGTPGAHTTPDAVAAADPDVLLFAWCGVGNRVPLARVIEQRAWHHLRAVQSRSVYCIPDDFLNTPAPTLMEGLAAVAAAVQPDLFPAHPELVRLA